MSTATQPASLPHSPSGRRSQAPDRPSRAQSTTTRPIAPASPRRSLSSSQAAVPSNHNRVPSNHHLQNVARQDFEQSSLARPGSSTRTETPRQPSSSTHSRTPSRYNSDQPTPAAGANVAAVTDSRSATTGPNLRRRTTIDAQTGHWDLGKTIGAGSMGKVKLARNKETGEQVAVKIVPRQSTDGEHRTQAERDRADHSKEIRTAREAAIVTLVDHPYICGMRDVVRTNYHWYMLFEYVNGGQMLDYIISHGRLKEKQARKFGRQIASALDYCHRNSIVHRDLKIENILISKNGDIKIIDFGLSNLFSPRSHLKTFCGSLYFAAPELLQAKQYTGPEVDVWSFGIVLYVLVCGKVPFDDQSMPQLHAKIKRGNVEYPPWLSPECRALIARMLNTNPTERATLTEIVNHPWMIKGFNGPPENHLPIRQPVQLPLNASVVDKMTGFDFGPADLITTQLTKIIESEDYQRAVRSAERRNAQLVPDLEQKRGVFGFYKRRNSTTSRDTLSTPSSEAVQLGNDPVNAFHPLISVYYLALEKQEREAREKNPGALAMPQSPGEKPLKIPDLPAPEAAYTNTAAYEMAGEKPTGGRARPRARTHGEDEVQQGLQNLNVNSAPSPTNPAIVEPPVDQQAPQPARKESTATSLLRRLSTRRHKDPPERFERSEKPSHPPPSLAVFSPSETPRKSFSVRRARERDPGATEIRPESAQATGDDTLLYPPAGDAASDRSKRSHGLGRSVSVNSSDIRRRLTRRGVSEGSSMRPPPSTSGGQSYKPPFEQSAGRDVTSDVEASMTRPQSGNIGSRTRSVGHRPKASLQERRVHRGDVTRTTNVPEETDQDMQDELHGHGGSHSPGDFKPVYLKGVFSVSTTSSRPLPFIRSDIIRVLQQLGVMYTEIRGGFRCRHVPSIKPAHDESAVLGTPAFNPSSDGSAHKRKISFGGFRERSNAERDAFRTQPPTSSGHAATARPRPSYTNSEEESEEDTGPVLAPSGPGRAAGETSTHVQSDLGSNMVLKFEIFVVKVPLLSLHGIQFKKVDGGTWQYKNMAQTILNELRL